MKIPFAGIRSAGSAGFLGMENLCAEIDCLMEDVKAEQLGEKSR